MRQLVVVLRTHERQIFWFMVTISGHAPERFSINPEVETGSRM